MRGRGGRLGASGVSDDRDRPVASRPRPGADRGCRHGSLQGRSSTQGSARGLCSGGCRSWPGGEGRYGDLLRRLGDQERENARLSAALRGDGPGGTCRGVRRRRRPCWPWRTRGMRESVRQIGEGPEAYRRNYKRVSNAHTSPPPRIGARRRTNWPGTRRRTRQTMKTKRRRQWSAKEEGQDGMGFWQGRQRQRGRQRQQGKQGRQGQQTDRTIHAHQAQGSHHRHMHHVRHPGMAATNNRSERSLKPGYCTGGSGSCSTPPWV